MEELEIEYTQEVAKEQFKQGNYPVAKQILEKLWEDSDKTDLELLFDYGQALRKTKDSIIFVEICRNPLKRRNYLSRIKIKSTLCWCLYDCYIKEYNYDVEKTKEFKEFLKRAQYIIDNTTQQDADKHCINPYVLTVKRVVKVYNDRPTKNYKEILKWLDYLEPDRLSEEEFPFQDENGIDRELASMKEFYYQNKVKALEKVENYPECIKVCNIALDEIKNFHYRNKTWIKARLYFSKCMEPDNIDTNIEEYKQLAYEENYWFMYHKLSQICFRYNKMEESLLYASKAIECKFEYEKMVNLFLDMALLWEQFKCDKNKAKIYYHASAFYRNRSDWNMPEELKYAISIYDINIEEKPNIQMIKSIASEYILEHEEDKRSEGKIKRLCVDRGFGFIEYIRKGQDIYFKIRDAEKGLVENDMVTYEISKGKDDRDIAIKIRKRS